MLSVFHGSERWTIRQYHRYGIQLATFLVQLIQVCGCPLLGCCLLPCSIRWMVCCPFYTTLRAQTQSPSDKRECRSRFSNSSKLFDFFTFFETLYFCFSCFFFLDFLEVFCRFFEVDVAPPPFGHVTKPCREPGTTRTPCAA